MLLIFPHIYVGQICTDVDAAGQDYLRAWWSDSVDSRSGLTYFLRDPRYTLGCCGVIKDWKIFVRNPGTFNFQVWRSATSGKYQLVGQNTYVYTAGEINTNPQLTMVPSQRISVQVGDILDWHTDRVDMVTYSAGTFTTLYLTQPAPSVGDAVNFATKHQHKQGLRHESLPVSNFVGAPSELTIQDSTPIGNTDLDLSVMDADTHDIPTLVVSMNWSSMFEIPANTDVGVYLKSGASPRYDNINKYILTVSCTNGVFTTNGNLTVSVLPTHAPVFVNWQDGVISTAAVLDYETLAVKTYSAIITFRNGRETSDAYVLSITVLDVNEAPSVCSRSYVIRTLEVPSGTSLGNPGIFCTDPDAGDTVTYSIARGSDSGHLSVNTTTGFVTMVTKFDLDSQPLQIYTIGCTLTCTDSGGLMDASSLKVIITDANDNTPQVSQAMYSFTLAVGSTVGTRIGQVIATDRDVSSNNNRVSFTLSSTTVFKIDSGGNITLTGTASLANPYIVTVTAIDSGGLSSTSILQILVLTNNAHAATTTESANDGFFSYAENTVWLTCAVVLGAGMFGMMGYFLYRCCKMKASRSVRQTRNVQSKTPNQQKGVEAKTNELIAMPATPLKNNIRVSLETRPRSPLRGFGAHVSA